MKETMPNSPRLEALRQALATNPAETVAQFWQEIAATGAPLVETIADAPKERLVTFLWRDDGQTQNVVLSSRVGAIREGWGKHMFTRQAGSDIWYKTYRFRSDLRVAYHLSLNDPHIDSDGHEQETEQKANEVIDPLNPYIHTYPKDDEIPDDEAYAFSVLELPDAPAQPWLLPQAGIPQGKVEKFTLHSDILGNTRRVYLYTPPNYTPDAEPYGLLMVFDGPVYAHPALVPTPTILDNLIAAGKIPPLVAVFPDSLDQETYSNATRNRELPCYEPFVAFIRQELLPWVRERAHITNDPARNIVAGSSYGGLAAAYVGFTAHDLFGNVLSQSGAFMWGPGHSEGTLAPDAEAWMIQYAVESPLLPIRFFLEAGLLETSPTATQDMVVVNRHMRDVLRAKGYEVAYSEYNGGHNYISWRGSFADGLLWLAGM